MTSYEKVRIIDPDERRYRIERRQQNRRAVFWGLTVLTVVFALIDIVSDTVLRNTAFHFHGISAAAWDFNGSVFSLVWTLVAISLWRDKN